MARIGRGNVLPTRAMLIRSSSLSIISSFIISIMALRNSPYLPLYVQDFLTDEKLADCSANANGVYIRLMCILHKSETYGKILLKQKYKQNESMCLNFASLLLRQMPYLMSEIQDGLEELLENKIIEIDGDYLFQKRMVKDGELSEKRAVAGQKGGKKAYGFCLSKYQSKTQSKSISKNEANSENENENDIDIDNDNDNEYNIKKFSFLKELLSIGVERKIAEEWIKVRKNKKLTQTETAFRKTKAEIDKSGRNANDCITLCVERSWGGFKAEWIERESPAHPQTTTATQGNNNDDWQL